MRLDKAVQRQIKRMGGPAWAAAETGISKRYLQRLAAGSRTNPSDETLEVLGIERQTDYKVVT